MSQLGAGFAYYHLEDKNIVTWHISLDGFDAEKLTENYVRNTGADKKTARQMIHVLKEQIMALNDTQSLQARSVRAHEEQHRTNDKLNIYAPGLSPEQYVVLNQYDECSANIAELNCFLSDYKKVLAEGGSREEALKAFDQDFDQKFVFYKDALARGLDPDSREGKKLMVQGTIKMWEETYRPMYGVQLAMVGIDAVDRSDAAATILGNEQELQKRINKIFNNLCENDYCKQNGFKSPGNLSQYLPEKRMGLEAGVRGAVAEEVEFQTGLNAEAREKIDSSIAGKTDRKKIRNLLKVLSGRKLPEQVTAKTAKAGKEQSREQKAVRIARIVQNQQTL